MLFLKVGYVFDIIYIKLDTHVCQKAALKGARDHFSKSGSMNGTFASSPRGLFFDYTASLQCPMFSRVVIHRLYIYIAGSLIMITTMKLILLLHKLFFTHQRQRTYADVHDHPMIDSGSIKRLWT